MLNWVWGGMIITGIFAGFISLLTGGTDAFSAMMTELLKSATLATDVVIGLMGMMCFWLGISKVMDLAGVTEKMARFLTPLFRVLMPEIPKGHPALGSITLNMAANMLGLDNAATPLGIRAMKELESLNPKPGTATNSQIMFLVINTSAVTIFPISIFLYRTKFGSASPMDVFLPTLISTSCSTIAGLIGVALVQKINLFKLPVMIFFTLMLGLIFGVVMWSAYAGADLVRQTTIVSNGFIMTFIAFVLIYGFIKHVKVYEEFINGAKEGFQVCIQILPYMVAMLSAVAIFRAGGVLTFILDGIRSIVEYVGIDSAFVDALPVSFMHPFSGGASRALMLDMFSRFGVDSFQGHLASVMQGSTETTFYVLAVYFGAVGVCKVRHAIACGLFADFAAMVASVCVGYFFFG